MGSDLPSTDSRSAGSSAGSAVSLILVESTVHSSEPISTPRDADFRARPTGTVPRRTAPRGHGTTKWRAAGYVVAMPSTSASHSSPYQPGSRSDTGSSNGTNRSMCGGTSRTTGDISTVRATEPSGTTARAARIATWWGLGSSPRMTKAPFTVAGKRSKWVRMDTASRTSPVMRSPAPPRSGPLLPRVQVLLLLWGEGVDLDPHRVQLQP